jgi:uncharacterized protein (DUF2267 family)
MSSTGFDPLDHAAQTAHAWLSSVTHEFATDDRHFAYRALRAWLHTLRDRLTVGTAVDFAAQLPELLRGMYYDGWQPAKAPIKYGPDEYRLRFAQEATIAIEEVPRAAAAVTAALRDRLAPGQLDRTLALFPAALRTIIQGPSTAVTPPEEPVVDRTEEPVAEPSEARLQRIEAQLATITEAVRTLAHGLEQPPYDKPGSTRVSHAAHRAHELLLTAPMMASNGGGHA